jgi:hypothetical protein
MKALNRFKKSCAVAGALRAGPRSHGAEPHIPHMLRRNNSQLPER